MTELSVINHTFSSQSPHLHTYTCKLYANISCLYMCDIIMCTGICSPIGLISPANCYIMYRYCYPSVLISLVCLTVILVITKQSHSLYTNIRNER